MGQNFIELTNRAGYGKRVYQEGEEQMVEESSEEEEVELGAEKLPENDSDDEDTPLRT